MKTSEELFSVRGNVVIITGGAGKLGREYARALSDAGARVALFDIVPGGKIPEGINGSYHHVDITDRTAVFAAVQAVLDAEGRIDVLINNAALDAVPGSDASRLQFSPYEDYPADLWERELAVGLTGMLFVTQAVASIMKKQNAGSIINISSIYGNGGPDNRMYDKGKFKSIAYATVKSGVLNFTRAWASYFAGTGIRVNTLTLGGVLFGQDSKFVAAYANRTILGRMAEPTEFCGSVLFLASDASRYMTGANLVVDGGWSAW